MNRLVQRIKYSDFGQNDGKPVYEFRITNSAGNYVELINYGAILKSIVVPDRYGNKENIILSFASLKGYEFDRAYVGATVGPFANRIAKASFSIGDTICILDKNDGENNNHSGGAGFNDKVFDFEMGEDTVTFILDSPDGEGGFPGNLNVKVIYKWTDSNELIIEYFAKTDKISPVNFTNHAYFNLTGDMETIHKHRLSIASNHILECTTDYVPTGNVLPAADKTFIGQTLADVMKGEGLNNYYIFNDASTAAVPVAILFEDVSGRMMKIYTSYPGLQLYTGDYLNEECTGFIGKLHRPFGGLCLECQYYPDSPNHAHFPNTLLHPKQIYNETITFTFQIQ